VRRQALTANEHEIFVNYPNKNKMAERWKSVFTAMINIGLRAENWLN